MYIHTTWKIRIWKIEDIYYRAYNNTKDNKKYEKNINNYNEQIKILNDQLNYRWSNVYGNIINSVIIVVVIVTLVKMVI